MTDPLALARPEILALRPYEHAAWDPRLERLHANESPWRVPGDTSTAGLNRYPEPQPQPLVEALAALYGVAPAQLLVGRGSDEAIDLLTRTFCAAGRDAVLVCPPTFGMYAVAALIQGAGVIKVPLRRDAGFALDLPALRAALSPAVKLVYLCTPNNPTGNELPEADVLAVLEACAGRALVVVDEAYAEFTTHPGYARRLAEFPHLVVLRTLSKAQGLAGARVGSLLASPAIVALLRKIIPPYAIAQPTVEAALQALQPSAQAVARERLATTLAERARLAAALGSLPTVLRVWPSAANFLLVEFHDAAAALRAIMAAGLIVRDFRGAGLGEVLRITIGSPEQNDRLIRSLA
ncbi:MAG: histidinol-phosphate transaminase [Sinobacteraceae bacterium]|nr:histidinol-phosphate transaminase [Nevskiaceae bacterium]